MVSQLFEILFQSDLKSQRAASDFFYFALIHRCAIGTEMHTYAATVVQTTERRAWDVA